MNSDSVQDFIEELNKINDIGDPAHFITNTIGLLKAGDKLFDESGLNEINSETFRLNISGTTCIEEIYNDKTNNRPVIDLVQQGGTMLGISLLGYTYIMEKAGVRFRSMAGTSAGAINTLLLSALPEKIYNESSPFIQDGRQATKSEFLAHLVANKDFSKFLDRRGTIGWLQKQLIKRISIVSKLIPIFLIALPVIMLIISFTIYITINGHLFTLANGLKENEIRAYDFITGTLGIVAVLLFILLLVFKLFKKNMGINQGEVVYNWMKSILETKFINIKTTEKLLDKKKKETQPVIKPAQKIEPMIVTNKENGANPLVVVNPKPETQPVIIINEKQEPQPVIIINEPPEKIFNDPRLVFIAANLTHNRIVKFPDNTGDYWKKDYVNFITPAAYVRASMSLPFIFYAFIPGDKHVQIPANSTFKNINTVHTLARFVDGGTLSNFPIREFHVAPPMAPKYPTFGVLLGVPDAHTTESDTAVIKQKFYLVSVFKFIVSFISTFRNFYDNDFLLNHPEFKHLVQAVDTSEFNSLDFGMDFKTKTKLFEQGAKTAIKQLQKFNWDEYLKSRVVTP